MSLRDDGYEPAMAQRTEASGDVNAAIAAVSAVAVLVQAQTQSLLMLQIEDGTPLGDAFDDNLAMYPLLVEAQHELGTIIIPLPPIFMRDLGKKAHGRGGFGSGESYQETMHLVHPPEGRSAGLLERKRKTPPVYPDTWPSHLRAQAKKKNDYRIRPLTGGML